MIKTQMDSSKLIEKLKEILSDENYDYAAAVVTYSEAKSNQFNYTGMAEFRDALTHIKRAVYTNDELLILDELNSSFEHIRRAAVESMQEYVELKYSDIRKRMYLSNLKSIFARHKKPDKKQLMISEQIIKENIAKGREAKPRKAWQASIGFFKKAEEELDKLDLILPTQDELNYQYSETIQIIIFVIVGIFIGRYLI